MILQADKGGKAIITTRGQYEEKMNEFIKESVECGAYASCEDIEDIRSNVESEYGALRLSLSEFFNEDAKRNYQGLCLPLSSEPYIIPRMMGSLKSHKPRFPIRPIITAPDCIGKNASKWMLDKLGIIAEFFKDIKVHSAHELFLLVANKQLPQSHKLVTWDYSSMFTNIPFDVAKSIIKDFYFLIQNETSVPVELFIELLSFLVDGIGYFTYKGRIYKQNRGLTMGNSLSQCLAEIVTSFAIYEALRTISKDKISFLVKYVDDIGGAMAGP